VHFLAAVYLDLGLVVIYSVIILFKFNIFTDSLCSRISKNTTPANNPQYITYYYSLYLHRNNCDVIFAASAAILV